MKTKACTRCGIEKPISDYYKRKSGTNAGKPIGRCRLCEKAARADAYMKNQEEEKKKRKIYYEKNKEKLRSANKRYVEINRDAVLEQKRKYYRENFEHFKNKRSSNYKLNIEREKENRKKWREENKESIAEANKLYRTLNKDKIAQKKKLYRKQNREKINKRARKYMEKIRKNNPEKLIASKLRTRLRIAIKQAGKHKNEKTFNLIGCDTQTLINHLESKFKPGMTWHNHGIHGWHIDHIIPCASFDLTDVNQQKKCFNYKNLQPLWAKENISKGSRIINKAKDKQNENRTDRKSNQSRSRAGICQRVQEA